MRQQCPQLRLNPPNVDCFGEDDTPAVNRQVMPQTPCSVSSPPGGARQSNSEGSVEHMVPRTRAIADVIKAEQAGMNGGL